MPVKPPARVATSIINCNPAESEALPGIARRATRRRGVLDITQKKLLNTGKIVLRSLLK
jgi:hypothetical protein